MAHKIKMVRKALVKPSSLLLIGVKPRARIDSFSTKWSKTQERIRRTKMPIIFSGIGERPSYGIDCFFERIYDKRVKMYVHR